VTATVPDAEALGTIPVLRVAAWADWMRVGDPYPFDPIENR
jgi:hypothetical protein